MKKISLILLALVLIASCERSTETEGPLLEDLYGDFTFLEGLASNSPNVDFPMDENIFFTAKFNINVDWEIHITGQNSGAHKIITGKSAEIDQTNGSWNGTTTNLPMFKNEPCQVILTVPKQLTPDSIPHADTISVTVTVPKVQEGFVVTDFEEGLNQGFIRFVQSGADMRFDTVRTARSPQGFAFYETSGNVTFADDLGNIRMPKSSFTDSDFVLSTNDDIVYFNVFAKKGPDAVQDIYVFQFKEDDNGDGVFSFGSDDLHEFVINSGLSQDWEVYSARYGDFVTTVSGGGGVKNPDRLIEIVVLPIGLKLPFEGFIDNMIFTENAPLQP
jgi:hypothetical protein